MEYKIESSKWGPYISIDGKMVFYDFFLDTNTWAKDLPKSVENPRITYHMWFSPLNSIQDSSTKILASKSLAGLEGVLKDAKEKAIKDNITKPEFEAIKDNLSKITTENYRIFFLLR